MEWPRDTLEYEAEYTIELLDRQLYVLIDTILYSNTKNF